MKVRFIILFSMVVMVAGCGNQSMGRTPADQQDLANRYDRESKRAAPRDAFPVLSNPTMSDVEQGNTMLDDNDWVIGISHNGEQKAYPIAVMGIHELANDWIGGDPITVCW